MYSDSVLLHHGPFIIPAHSTWPWQVLTQGFSARTRASWCVQFCVWHAVHSVNVCWMQILRDVSYWFVLYLKKEGCPGKEHLVKAEGLIWRKIYYFGRKVCWQNTIRQKSLSSTPPMSRLHECYPELDLLSLKLNLVLGVMRWVTLSAPFLPTPRLPPDFIVATGPSCIFLPGCKIQEMFVSWGEIECMEEICRPQYRYKFRSCSLYEGLKQIV